jgi:hypothetical protein
VGGEGDELSAAVGGVGAALHEAPLLEGVHDEGRVGGVDADRLGDAAQRQRSLREPQ